VKYQTQFMNPVNNPEPLGDWIIIFLLGLLLAYAMVRILFPRYWYRYRQALMYPIEANKLLEEKNTNQLQASLFLNTLAIISGSAFVCVAAVYLNTNQILISPEIMVIYLSVGIVLTLLKFSGTRFLGYLFQNDEVSVQYNHIWLIHLKITGLALLFCTIILLFIPQEFKLFFIVVGLVLLLIMLIMNTLRGFSLLFQHKVSILYGILYLCTLEILPILVISRLINA
jgi:hypothetical protein